MTVGAPSARLIAAWLSMGSAEASAQALRRLADPIAANSLMVSAG
jgi:hypothetical protein